jgi:hypothetical protein
MSSRSDETHFLRVEVLKEEPLLSLFRTPRLALVPFFILAPTHSLCLIRYLMNHTNVYTSNATSQKKEKRRHVFAEDEKSSMQGLMEKENEKNENK